MASIKKQFLFQSKKYKKKAWIQWIINSHVHYKMPQRKTKSLIVYSGMSSKSLVHVVYTITSFEKLAWAQECKARKVYCGRVYSEDILKPVLFGAEFVNKNRCISVRLVSEEVKSIKFWTFW